VHWQARLAQRLAPLVPLAHSPAIYPTKSELLQLAFLGCSLNMHRVRHEKYPNPSPLRLTELPVGDSLKSFSVRNEIDFQLFTFKIRQNYMVWGCLRVQNKNSSVSRTSVRFT
jgi:hypothetical protein